MDASITEVRQSLDPELRVRFDTALVAVSFAEVDLAQLFGGEVASAAMVSGIRDRLDGLTGEEVIALGDSIVLAETVEEVASLEARRDSAEQAQAYLQAFTVDRATTYLQERMFMDEVVVELDVTNGLDVPISRAHFRGRLQSPDRSVPWMEEDFNYQIPGGLEPEESASWRLSPSAFSGNWDRVEDAQSDAVFTVIVERLDGPDGEPLMGGVTWDDEDQERLDEATARLQRLAP